MPLAADPRGEAETWPRAPSPYKIAVPIKEIPMTALRTTEATQLSPEQLVAYADGALGAAGHEVTDPVVRDLMDQVARGEITGDEAVARARAYFDA